MQISKIHFCCLDAHGPFFLSFCYDLFTIPITDVCKKGIRNLNLQIKGLIMTREPALCEE